MYKYFFIWFFAYTINKKIKVLKKIKINIDNKLSKKIKNVVQIFFLTY